MWRNDLGIRIICGFCGDMWWRSNTVSQLEKSHSAECIQHAWLHKSGTACHAVDAAILRSFYAAVTSGFLDILSSGFKLFVDV